MKLILINGQQATGKSSTARLLGRKIISSAVVDVDTIMMTNPWDYKESAKLSIKNFISLTENFRNEGFENIIVSGLTMSQDRIDMFLEALKMSAEIIFVWLRASKETRQKRMLTRDRDDADKPEYFEFNDKNIPDLQSVNVPGKFLAIDTDDKTIQDVVDEIKTFAEL